MKKKIVIEDTDMLPEYDFSGGIRGKYAARFAELNGYVKLDPEVTKFFKNADDINNILSAIINSSPFKNHYSTL